MKSKVYSITDEDFKHLIATCFTYSDALRELGLGTRGGSSLFKLKQRIRELCIDISHFGKNYGKNSRAGKRRGTYSIEEICVINSTYTNRSRLKCRLIKQGFLENKCYSCGIVEWFGEEIVLHLEHKNGINNDNRIENLELLCPNCHSQTNTYGGKNVKNTNKKGAWYNGIMLLSKSKDRGSIPLAPANIKGVINCF